MPGQPAPPAFWNGSRIMLRFGYVSLPFLGLVTAARWTSNQGLGLDIDRKTGTTLWIGRWEVNADAPAAFALPILAPLAMLVSRRGGCAGAQA